MCCLGTRKTIFSLRDNVWACLTNVWMNKKCSWSSVYQHIPLNNVDLVTLNADNTLHHRLTRLWRCSWSGSPGSWRAWCCQPRGRTGGHPRVSPARRVCRTAWATAGCLRRASSRHVWRRAPAEARRKRPVPKSPTVSGGPEETKTRVWQSWHEQWQETVVSWGQFDDIIRSDTSNCQTKE